MKNMKAGRHKNISKIVKNNKINYSIQRALNSLKIVFIKTLKNNFFNKI